MTFPDRGLTLVELLVVLVLIGLSASVVGLALGTSTASTTDTSLRDQVTVARDSAIRAGRPVTVRLRGRDVGDALTALPDGRVIADSALAIDRLSGDEDAAR